MLHIISKCGDWSPHGSPKSAYLKKNIKMTNFAPCGPIFKIRNSKLVYSKSYKQITGYIFFITSTFRLLLCYFVHFYTQRSRILKNQHCCPTVHCPAYVHNFEFSQNEVLRWNKMNIPSLDGSSNAINIFIKKHIDWFIFGWLSVSGKGQSPYLKK